MGYVELAVFVVYKHHLLYYYKFYFSLTNGHLGFRDQNFELECVISPWRFIKPAAAG